MSVSVPILLTGLGVPERLSRRVKQQKSVVIKKGSQ